MWLLAKLEPAVESKLESDLGMRMIEDIDDDDEDGRLIADDDDNVFFQRTLYGGLRIQSMMGA